MLNNRDQRHGNKIGALEAAELTLGELNRNSTHRHTGVPPEYFLLTKFLQVLRRRETVFTTSHVPSENDKLTFKL